MPSGTRFVWLLHAATLLLCILKWSKISSEPSQGEQSRIKSLNEEKKPVSPCAKIYALLTVHDYRQALDVSKRLVSDNPASKPAWHAYLKALAKIGHEKELIAAFHVYLSRFSKDASRDAIEEIAWGIIEKGLHSPTVLIRYYSCVAASMAHDAKSVALLEDALADRNPQLRCEVLNLISQFRDSTLQYAVYRLLLKERHPLVRVEAIRALGRMNVKAAEKKLLLILSDEHSFAEEKAAAIEALVNLMGASRCDEIEQLTQSKRAGLRELACRAISHTLSSDQLEFIVPLLNDSIPLVRAAAAQTIGILHTDAINHLNVALLLTPLMSDSDPYVAISAAWAMTLFEKDLGLSHLKRWLEHSNKSVRHFAAGALAKTGNYGVSLMLEKLSDEDPFVKVNLALGLIAVHEEPEKTSMILSEFLEESKQRVMWSNEGLIRFLSPSKVKFHPLIPHLPDANDQLTRLELLNIMALTEDPRAVVSARNFLKKPTWGISGLAASLILSEGDDQSVGVVAELLSDSDRNIRVQAALILALWGRDEKAISALEDAYCNADREMKERILEGIGAVGSTTSIPFLLESLKEPYQTLRIIASASLLRCLYH